AVLATTAAVLLGLWQYGAWHAHRDDKAASLIRTSPRPLSSVIGGDDAFPAAAVGQPVRFAGRWLPGAPVYVPDRALPGRLDVPREGPGRSHAGLLAEAGRVHRSPEPALRHGVVGVRGVRGVPVVAVVPRRARAAPYGDDR